MFILLITLWALNLADLFQTVYLKETGFLAKEANYFVDFFLKSGHLQFFLAKILALVLITSILLRGWFDRRGIKLGANRYTREQVRSSLQFLLIAGIIYYVLIVGFPFFAMAISGLFTAPEQASL